MKEYENEHFFLEYAKMDRSKNGLKSAGEWHQLEPLMPPLKDLKVLDLGCGYGWHCKYASDHGAKEILGIDASQRMIQEAIKRNSGKNITYQVKNIETFKYPNNYYDFVLSNLALHYIEDLDSIFKKVYSTLVPGSTFLFNIEHPTFTAGINQDWIYNEKGQIKYWAIDNYYYPGKRITHFLGCDVLKYHHTLTQIIMGLIQAGFQIEAIEEATPPDELLNIEGMKDEFRRPMMLLVKAKKNS